MPQPAAVRLPRDAYTFGVTTRIGISLCLDARGQWRPGRDYLYADRAYTAAVAAAGGLPFHLPVQASTAAAALIAQIDGLLIPGGDDFLPEAPYPEAAHFEPLDDAQVAFDEALITAASAAGKPVLGVCYGMQLLALNAGGALHYHLPADRPDARDHGAGASGTVSHPVTLQPDSDLGRWIGQRTLEVNSRHHQAVADAGTMRVVARADDGVIEAIESTAGPPRFGVQWHPESIEGDAGSRLLAAFIEQAGARRDPPGSGQPRTTQQAG